MQHDWTVFRRKRVLVTGDTGFKGSWLCLWLHRLGADVVGYGLPPEQPNAHFNLLKLHRLIHHITGDIRDLKSLSRAAQGHRPEFFFHLAAQPLVKRSYEEPKLTFDTNVGGSVNVLEVIRSTPSLRAAIYVTSDKCYRNREIPRGYRETDELGGIDPYSASKAAAEMAFGAYFESFLKARKNFGIASVRAGNVIGGGDWSADRIVPDIVRALRKRDPITLRFPQATRPWQHVLDPLSGYLQLAARLAGAGHRFSGSWNFGPGESAIRTVRDLAEAFVSHWGEGRIRIRKGARRVHEAGLLQLNSDKAHRLLRWHPRWAFDDAVSRTAEWYKGVLAGRPASEISQGQIQAFMEGRDDRRS